MKLSNVLLTASVFAGMAYSTPVDVVKPLKIDFKVKRGSSVNDADTGRQALFKRADDGAFNMTVENEQTFYMANLSIGSNGDVNEVLVDTGSSDLWVMGTDLDCISSSSLSKKRKNVIIHPAGQHKEVKASPVVDDVKLDWGWIFSDTDIFPPPVATDAPAYTAGSGGSGGSTNTCTSYGSFETGTSDTFHSNHSAFSISYADGSVADGVWAYDNVVIQGVTINDLSFAVVNETSSSIGVLGIGLPGLETTYSGGTTSYMYENLPQKLRSQGLINKAAFSLYLNSPDAEAGSVLFGAVDHAKYSGTLQTVAVVNTAESQGYNFPIKLEITLSSILFDDGGTNYTISNIPYSAILDSGSTLSYFPTDLLTNVINVLDGVYSSDLQAYQIQCTTDSSVSIQLDFTGATISVPLSDLLLQYGENQCYLAIMENSGDYILFGDNVLRSAYLVYDLDDYQISLAQANYSDDEDIEIISSSVPSAVLAADYSSTFVSVGSETLAATGPQVQAGGGATATGSSTSRAATTSSSSSGSSSNNSSDGARSMNPSVLLYLGGVLSCLVFLISC